jgi:tRNA1(Val) A37 N6-methylase TrmN6
MNIYTGSFLDEGFDKHMKEVWGLDGFDIIVGNPPYQQNDGGGRNLSSAKPLYNLFVEKSIPI